MNGSRQHFLGHGWLYIGRHFLVLTILFWSLSWGSPLARAFGRHYNLVLEPLLGGPPSQNLWKTFPGNNNLVLEPLLGRPPGHRLWKAFPGNNNLVLEPLLGGTRHFLVLTISFWSLSWGDMAFPGNSNLILEPLLGGPPGQTSWPNIVQVTPLLVYNILP